MDSPFGMTTCSMAILASCKIRNYFMKHNGILNKLTKMYTRQCNSVKSNLLYSRDMNSHHSEIEDPIPLRHQASQIILSHLLVQNPSNHL